MREGLVAYPLVLHVNHGLAAFPVFAELPGEYNCQTNPGQQADGKGLNYTALLVHSFLHECTQNAVSATSPGGATNEKNLSRSRARLAPDLHPKRLWAPRLVIPVTILFAVWRQD
jgi:hypothetical protein